MGGAFGRVRWWALGVGLGVGLVVALAPPFGAPPPPAAAQYGASGVALSAVNGVVYRWHDGDWIARVTIQARNDGAAPVTLARGGFSADGFTPWNPEATFPESVTLAPGQSARGDCAWYASRSQALPPSVTVRFGTWSQLVNLIPVPLPPAPGLGVVSLTGRVEARFLGPAETWRHTDQDHIVRVRVELANRSNLPFVVPRRYFQVDYGSHRGTYWSPASDLAPSVPLSAGVTVRGVAAWYFDDALPPPERVTVRLGPAQGPLASTELDVRAIRRPR